MDIKKTSVKDIYNWKGIDLPKTYKHLKEVLGADMPFAEINIGSGYYVWSDSGCAWRQMTEVGDIEQSFVINALVQSQKEIAAKVGEKTAEVLFTYPDESYIFFNEDGGNIRILITGWGFKKPVHQHIKAEVDDIRKKNAINISFSSNGQKLPNYEFGIRLSKQVKRLSTNEQGIYHFERISVGSTYTLVDIRSNKEYTLEVIEGKSDYDFSVTTFSTITINATEDGKPVCGETATLSYNGKEYNVTTDSNGQGSIAIPVAHGASVSASLRGETQSAPVSEQGNAFNFEFSTIQEPSETDVRVQVLENGAGVSGKAVSINYAGQTIQGTTDGNGMFAQRLNVVNDAVCHVNVDGYDSQSRSLSPSETNEFVFNKTITPEAPKRFTPHIFIEGDKGFIGSKYPVTVEYENISTDYVSDENGIIALPEMEEGKMMKVTDNLNPDNIATYTLDHEQERYVFHVPYEPMTEAKDIKIMVRNNQWRPIHCDKIRFLQEGGNERLMNLDAEGNTYLAKDTFKMGVPITTTILGAQTNYPPITFTMEEGENEYLLIENSNSSSFGKVLLEILAVLGTIVGLTLIWIVFSGVTSQLLNVINF